MGLHSWFSSSSIATVLDNLNRNFKTTWISVNYHTKTPNYLLAINQLRVRLVARNSERHFHQRCLDRFILRGTLIPIPQRITVKLSGASTVARGSRVHYLARQTECSHRERKSRQFLYYSSQHLASTLLSIDIDIRSSNYKATCFD